MRHLLLCVLLVSSLARAQSPPESATYAPTELGQRLVGYAKEYEPSGFSGAVLAAMDGKVVAAAGFGFADEEGKVPNTPGTLYEIASLTKQFTAAAVLRLAQDKKLSLADPIAKYLPPIPEDCRGITIEHLLRHTSGIPGSNSQGSGEDIAAVLPGFLKGGPRYTPGEHFEYWNQGYAILSEIIKVASGQEYTDYCRDHVFRPAGMSSTLFTGDAAPEGARVAIGRAGRGKARSALEHPYGGYGLQYRGMGGVVTTVWDLYRWDRALNTDAILSDDSVSRLFEPGPGGYALGWFVKEGRRGRLVQSHGGSVRGFTCELRRYPEHDAVLIVLCNRDNGPLQRVTQGLETILFGGQPSGGKPLRGLEQAVADAITGAYTDDEGRTLAIEVQGVVTRATLRWSPESPPTIGALRVDDAGGIVMDDGIERSPVAIEPGDGTPVKTIKVMDMTFRRDP